MYIKKIIKNYKNSQPKRKNDFLLYFKPKYFEKFKLFSLSIKSINSLVEYADLHHKGRFALNMGEGGGLNKFSKKEKILKNNIESLIYKTFKKKKNIQDSFSGAVISARYIIKYFNKCNVFEIGPGTGYLGLLLKKAGFNYSCFEITQSHFIYQAFIFKKILGNHAPVPILKNNEKGKLKLKSFQIPSWQAPSLPKYLNLIKPKIIIMNHCVNEMSREALNYLCEVLSRLDNQFYIFIEGFGAQDLHNTESSLNIFYLNNFKIFSHQPSHKYNITPSKCKSITLLSNKITKSNISYINLRGFFSNYGIRRIFYFLLNFYRVRFDLYKYKIYFLNFLIIKKY
jgi:hypothetical protein